MDGSKRVFAAALLSAAIDRFTLVIAARGTFGSFGLGLFHRRGHGFQRVPFSSLISLAEFGDGAAEQSRERATSKVVAK